MSNAMTESPSGGWSRALLLSSLLILFGEEAWAQWTWSRLPEHPPISEFALCEDPVRQRVVLFGGRLGGLNDPTSDETWEWDGDAWRLRYPSNSPPARVKAAMAFDPVTGKVLLFGGHDDQGALFGDTWLWDGRDWQQVTIPGPPARALHRMATDPVRRRIVLFGGVAGQFFLLSPAMQDTWEWDGTAWTQKFPASLVPAPRSWHGMAFNSLTNRVAMFGGCDGFARLPATIPLEWDGTDWRWVGVASAPTPGSRCGLDVASDPVSGGVFLHGGFDGNASNDDLFLWNGSRWSLLSSGASPVRESTDFLVTDTARQQVLTFGATDRSYPDCDAARQTWTWSAGSGAWAVNESTVRAIRPGQIVHDSRRDCFWVIEQAWCNGGVVNRTWKLTDDGSALHPTTNTPSVALAYHEASGLVVGHDGLTGVTWTFDGNDWLARTYPQMPPSSGGPAYDPVRRRVLFYTNQEVWAWVPTGWTLLAPANPGLPMSSRLQSVAYDAARRRLVILGQLAGPSGIWEWDGSSWSPMQPISSVRDLAYVPALGGCLVFLVGRQALWDGTSLTPLNLLGPSDPDAPAGRIAYDPNRRRVRTLPDVPGIPIWDLSLRSFTVTPPDPTLGTTLTFAMDIPSEAGKPWLAGLSTALYPGIPVRPSPYYGTEVLPLAPDPLLLSSLSLGIGGVLDGQGRGQVSIQVPPWPFLLGTRLHTGAVTFGPGLSLDHVSPAATFDIVP